MKDRVEIDHLTKYDAFRVNKDQVMDREIYGSKSIWFNIQLIQPTFNIWFKIQLSLILRQRPLKPYKLLKFLISFVTTVKSSHATTI